MASSSSSHQQNRESNAFSGIEPAGKRRKVSESSRLFDVFINHRGPDVKQTLATELYNSLRELGIHAFLDSEEKELGNSFPSTIETAIRSAKAHIAIFSKRYAESPWCLAELVLMRESKAKIIPVFYEVEPWELRHIEKGVYADAFMKYEGKGRYLDKLSEWKEALQTLSFIAGEVFHGNYQTIVAAVAKEVQRKRCLYVAEHPVGLNNLVKDFEKQCLNELVEDFENQCGLKERKNMANVVGMFGMGGVGKTTLAKELFNRKHSDYSRASFLFDVREAFVKSELPRLQTQLVKDLFLEEKRFRCIGEGTSYLKDHLQRSHCLNFLIVVDDIDHVEQLHALLIKDILNKSDNSLIIVTTRDVGVVISAGITVGYPLKGMDRNHGRELFCWHAFDHPLPRAGYEALVEQFVGVCGGLPLSLLVLGRLVHGRDHRFWELKLKKARETLPQDVKQRLKISFDSLEDEEKQVFMDIACFFLGKPKRMAERICEESGWDAQNALQTLKDKCLLEEKKGFWYGGREPEILLRMHDHLRDLGREMAGELSSPRRLWRPQDLESLELKGLQTVLAETNSRCFHSIFEDSIKSKVTFFLGQSDSCGGTSASLLWLELRSEVVRRIPTGLWPVDEENEESDITEQLMIPSWIPLQNLRYLRIFGGRFKTLWENRRQIVPYQHQLSTSCRDLQGVSGSADPLKLRELTISHCPELEELPSLSRLSCMEKIEIDYCDKLQNITLPQALISLSVHQCGGLQRVVGYTDLTKLTELIISHCPELEELPSLSRLSCMEKIDIYYCDKLQNITLPQALISLSVQRCRGLQRVVGYSDLTKLTQLIISHCPELEELPSLSRLSCMEKIQIDYYEKLQNITLPQALISLSVQRCRGLQRVVGYSDLTKLTQLIIRECPELEELPSLSRLSCMEKIDIYYCDKLQNITLPQALISLSVQWCRGLQRVVGYSDLTKFTQLIIRKCPELEELPSLSRLSCMEKIQIDYCDKLQNITLPQALISLSVHGCRGLQREIGYSDLTKLTELIISECPELEELPSLSRLSCMEKIEIGYYEKLQNITLPQALISLSVLKCRGLQRVVGYSDLTKLTQLKIRECPELEELPSLSRLSCMEKIDIYYCDKLQNITLPQALISLSVEWCGGLHRVVGYSDLTKLTQLIIRNCPELEELPSLSRLSCMEKIHIYYCDKLQNITLPQALISLSVHQCGGLQRVVGYTDLTKLTELIISHCPELEELPSLSRLSCMEKIEIDYYEKLQNITLPQALISLSVHRCRGLQRVVGYSDLTKLTQLIIRECPELEELPSLSRLSCMEKIEIYYCDKLQNITLPQALISLSVHQCGGLQRVVGYTDLTKLTELIISHCPELEELPSLSRLSCMEKIEIDYYEKLQNITLPQALISLSVRLCRGLQRVVGYSDLTKLTQLIISGCPKLEELPSLSRLSCMEKIQIDYCDKLQNITLPQALISLYVHRCRGLQRVVGYSDLTKLTQLIISECPELEELPSLSRLSCMEKIQIDYCDKLQNITLPQALISLSVHRRGGLQRIVGYTDLTKLTELIISHCPELEELPSLSRLSCIEKIEIDYCDKLQNITLPQALISLSVHRCRGLQRVVGYSDLTKLTQLIIRNCPELEELPSLSRLSCMEKIQIDSYEKLQNITLPQALISLSIRRCRGLQRVVGYSDITILTELIISHCPELEELPSLSRLSCMGKIGIDYCDKLQNITLPQALISLSVHRCRGLQRVVGYSDLTKLTQLIIRNCPELEELPSLSRLSCMEKIQIDYCDKLQNITLPQALISLSVHWRGGLQRVVGYSDITKLTELIISHCPELEELSSLSRLSCMEKIGIDYCDKLQNITLPQALISLSVHRCRGLQRVVGYSDLTKLTQLIIRNCPELEELPSLSRLSCMEKIQIDSYEKLQNITLPQALISLSIRRCRGLQRVVGYSDLTKLTQLIISHCPELEELPSLSRLSCMEKIEIDSNEKLQNITLPQALISLSIRRCRGLQRVVGYSDLTKLTQLIISECPELEELPVLSRVSCMKTVEIDCCQKLEKISGIQELCSLQRMRLGYCSNAVLRNCIHELKCVPRRLTMIGKAVDGAESSLNEYLFSEFNAVTEIVTHNSGKNSGHVDIKEWWKKWEVTTAAVIGCFLVVIDSSNSAKDINDFCQRYDHRYIFDFSYDHETFTSPMVREGEWIITMVASDNLSDNADYNNAEYALSRKGVMRKGFRVEVKKGQEGKYASVLYTIVDKLHEQGVLGEER